ncbi:MAG TPA: SUMF1/EgtB/PvdO family nonheme iron enzyme [Gemmatimonadales bacterium]|nr:SUMF1/EgtB/PvdO family nonheme iron enzyme [Gemmatimonadales bacterium]
MPSVAPIDTRAAVEWYRRNRARSEQIFDLIEPSAYYSRPISLRNPIVFYEGHLPAFSVIAFLRRGLGLPPVDARLEQLFERGIDPDSEAAAVPRSGASTVWPSRDEVRAFGRACDEAVLAAMATMPSTPEALEGLYTALEHEAMHQETLLYMWHRLPYEQKRGGDRGAGIGDRGAGVGGRSWGHSQARAKTPTSVVIPAGFAHLGADRDGTPFGWDNEFAAHDVPVPQFDIDTLPVTNAQYLEFIASAGYSKRELWSDEGWEWIRAEAVSHPAFWMPRSPIPNPRSPISAPRSPIPDPRSPEWLWRGMFEALPLPLDWPVYVSHAEASAYARWKGRRLMTEPEFHRAAEGSTTGHFDFAGFDPIPVGSHPPSTAGVYDLVGNGWEWTSTVFGPFAGFEPMRSYPEYSADFFDGRHVVMKGASPATARELVRPSFRNWFRGNYPYVYAKFRTVR